MKKIEYYFRNPLCHRKSLEERIGKKFFIIEPIGPGCPGGCPLCFAERKREDPISISNKRYMNLKNRVFINETSEATLPGREKEVSEFYSSLPQNTNILNLVTRFPSSLHKTLLQSNLDGFDLVVVQIAYTGFNGALKEKWEPGTNDSKTQLRGIAKLINTNYEVSVRLEPLYPKYHTDEKVSRIIRELADIGVKHITTETLKLTERTIKLVKKLDSNLLEYYDLEKFYREFYPKKYIRDKLLASVIENTDRYGIAVAFCLENNLKCDKSCNIIPNALCEGISSNVLNKIDKINKSKKGYN